MVSKMSNNKAKICFFNGGDYGSTGRIINTISASLNNYDFIYVCRKIVDKERHKGLSLSDSFFNLQWNRLFTKFFGLDGFRNYFFTRKIVRFLKKEKPDLIHFNNLHGYYINLPILLKAVKKQKIQVIWTLHDCWTFTGRCAYYSYLHCNEWETKCQCRCKYKKEYPVSIFKSFNANMALTKEKLINELNAVFISPSGWLISEFKKSFLKNNEIRLIYNGIRTDCFFRKRDFENFFNIVKYTNVKEKIICSVANPWSKRKGLEDILKISKVLTDYTFLIVGLEKFDVKENVIFLKKVSIDELRVIYSCSDVQLFTSYDDNLPSVLIECLLCGTPCVSYDTGGCSEILNEKCGILVKQGSIENAADALNKILKNNLKFESKNCIEQGMKFSDDLMVQNYSALYNELLKKGDKK